MASHEYNPYEYTLQVSMKSIKDILDAIIKAYGMSEDVSKYGSEDIDYLAYKIINDTNFIRYISGKDTGKYIEDEYKIRKC